MKSIGLLLCVVVIVSGKVYKSKAKVDPYADFFGKDKDLNIPEEDEDKPPTDFKGNVQQATITNSENRNFGKGKFKNTFETQNGIQVSQVGKLKDNKTFVVMGSYSYTGADGKRYIVKYTADEFGYHPKTELEVDIPDLVIPAPTTRPAIASSFPKIEFNTSSQKGKAPSSAAVGGNGVNNRFGSGANGAFGSNSQGGINGQGGNSKGGFGGGNRDGNGINGSDNTYLPPNKSVEKKVPDASNTYLPPNKSVEKKVSIPEADNIYLPPLKSNDAKNIATNTKAIQILKTSTTRTTTYRTIPKTTTRTTPKSTTRTTPRTTTRTTPKPTTRTKSVPDSKLSPSKVSGIVVPQKEQFTYGKATPPPSQAEAKTYKPSSGYLPPATYLPPIGVKPNQRS